MIFAELKAVQALQPSAAHRDAMQADAAKAYVLCVLCACRLAVSLTLRPRWS